jgi:hypothetical protein
VAKDQRFQAVIQEAFGAMSTKHFQQPASLTTQILQQFEYANSLSRKGGNPGRKSSVGSSFFPCGMRGHCGQARLEENESVGLL